MHVVRAAAVRVHVYIVAYNFLPHTCTHNIFGFRN